MRGSKYEIIRLIVEENIAGKRSVEDARTYVIGWFSRPSTEIFRVAVSMATAAIWIANFRQQSALLEKERPLNPDES